MSEKSLAAALIAAQQAAQGVTKDSKNEFHRYKYASSEAIIEEARAALSSAGLAVLTLGWKPSEDKTTMCVRYRLLALSGELLDFECSTAIVPEKGRPQDKAEATALTYSLGYFLRGLLLLPRVDAEHEVDKRNDTGKEAKPAVPAAESGPTATVFSKSEHETFLRQTATASEAGLEEIGKSAFAAYRRGGLSADEYKGVKDAGALRLSILQGKAKKGAAA